MNSTAKNLAKTKVALIGSSGKMGQKILELLKEDQWQNKIQIVAELNSKSTLAELPNDTQVIVDFSNAPSTLKWAAELSKLEKKIPYLICTTGFSADEFSEIKKQFKQNAWAFIPNTSLGIYAFIRCLCGLVMFFKDIQSIEIHDVHHVHKKDSPSGTALLIKGALMEALSAKGFPKDIHIQSAREGEVVGIHSVVIQRTFDRLILTHEAQDRKLFAEGALSLAEKLALKSPREKPYTFDELL